MGNVFWPTLYLYKVLTMVAFKDGAQKSIFDQTAIILSKLENRSAIPRIYLLHTDCWAGPSPDVASFPLEWEFPFVKVPLAAPAIPEI